MLTALVYQARVLVILVIQTLVIRTEQCSN